MKLNVLAFAALLLLCTASCKQENQISGPAENDLQKMREHLINTYGFAPESIKETETDFVVEGDQLFSKASYWEDFGPCGNFEHTVGAPPAADGSVTDRKHYRSTYLIDKSKWPTIHVNISEPGIPQAWRNAIIDAVEEWNYTDGWFYFDVTYLNYSVNGSINVKMSSDIVDDLVVASCYYPTSSRKPGSPMYLNPKHNNLPYAQKVHAMVHEIGHALGIRHTDQGQGTLISNVPYSCRTASDWSSVMQPYVDDWAGFTDCDYEAYWSLYGW